MHIFWQTFKNELYKTYKRPRTYIGFAIVIFICCILQAAFYQDGKEILSFVTQQIDAIFDIKGDVLNGNLICYILLQTLILQMPLLVALVTGDAVSSETASGTIRFLLTTSASRTHIIMAKWCTGILYTFLLLLLLGIMSLWVPHIVFGGGDLMALNSDALTVIPSHDLWWRWVGAFGIAMLSLSLISTLALMFSAWLDNSVTPIVSVMAVIIVFTIIGLFDLPTFDAIKPFLFTTHMISWKSFFEDPVPYNDIIFSASVLLLHIVALLLFTLFYFKRKDINT